MPLGGSCREPELEEAASEVCSFLGQYGYPNMLLSSDSCNFVRLAQGALLTELVVDGFRLPGMMIRKALLRCGAPAFRELRYPHLLAPRACVFGVRSFADAASPAVILSLFNGAWNSLSKVSQAVQQQQMQGFELEMNILEPALASLEETTLPPKTRELLRRRMQDLDGVAQGLTQPGVLERARQAVTLGAEGEKLRAQLTSLAVFVLLCKVDKPSASKGLPFLIWQGSLPRDLARTLDESWSKVPRGLRPVCFTMDAEVAKVLEESGAFLHVQVCSEPELQVLQSGRGANSMAFWMEQLQAMLPEPAQKQITGGNPTKQSAELPFREISHKCMQDVEGLKTRAAQGHGRPSNSTRQVRVVTADMQEPTFVATAGCSAFIGSSRPLSSSLLRIDPSNPRQVPRTVELPRGDLVGIASCGRRVVASLRNELHLLDLESMSWKLLAEVTGWPRGLSMDSQAVYWACLYSETVRCLDLRTGQKHVIMGVEDKSGCGQPGERPETFKLQEPIDTALLGTTLFVADLGNGRVLSFDMNSREVNIVYEGGLPVALATHDGCLYVHDRSKHQVFRVCLESMETRPFLGSGSQGFSRDGLPPLATNLYDVTAGGLDITPGGELLVADRQSGVVRAVSLQDEFVGGALALSPPSTAD